MVNDWLFGLNSSNPIIKLIEYGIIDELYKRLLKSMEEYGESIDNTK